MGTQFTDYNAANKQRLRRNAQRLKHANLANNLPDGSIGTATLANDAVTYAKMQNVSATDKVLGRSTAGAGNVTTTLQFSSGITTKKATATYALKGL